MGYNVASAPQVSISSDNYDCSIDNHFEFDHRPHTGSSSIYNRWCVDTGYENLVYTKAYLWSGVSTQDVTMIGVDVYSMGSFWEFDIKRMHVGYQKDNSFIHHANGGDFVKYFTDISGQSTLISFEYTPIVDNNIQIYIDFIPGNYIKRYACMEFSFFQSMTQCSSGVVKDACLDPQIHQCSEGCRSDDHGGYSCYCYSSNSTLAQDGKTCRYLQVCEHGWRYSAADNQCYRLIEYTSMNWADYQSFCTTNKVLTNYQLIYDSRFPYNILNVDSSDVPNKEKWYVGLYTSHLESKLYWLTGVSYEDRTPYVYNYTGNGSIYDVVGVYDENTNFINDVLSSAYYICNRPKDNIGSCPSSWDASGSMCYYYSTRQMLSYEDAYRECAKLGAMLAYIDNNDVTNIQGNINNALSFTNYQQCQPKQGYWTEGVNNQKYYLSGYNLYSASASDKAFFFCKDNPKLKSKDNFVVYSETKNFYQAASKCETLRGYLAITTNTEEFKEIQNLVISVAQFWPIGIIDVNGLNRFDTSIVGTDVVIDNWSLLRPLPLTVDGGNCVFMRSSDLTWINRPCNDTFTRFICRQNDDAIERYLLSSFMGVAESQIQTSPALTPNTAAFYGYGTSRVVRSFQSLYKDQIGNLENNPWKPDQTDPEKPVFIMVNFYGEVKLNGIVVEGKCDRLSFSLRCQLASTYIYYKTSNGYKVESKLRANVTRDIIYFEYSLYCYQIDMIWSKDSTCTKFSMDYIGTMGHTAQETDLINECVDSTSDCAHQCVDTLGSYYCLCNDGYKMAVDGRRCIKLEDTRCHDLDVGQDGCYFFVSQKKVPIQAKEQCLTFGGRLASVNSLLEQKYLADKMQSLSDSVECDQWLIGLEGTIADDLRWSDKSRVQYAYFARNGHGSGNRVVMDKANGWRWQYKQIDSNHPHCFVCKYNNRACEESLLNGKWKLIYMAVPDTHVSYVRNGLNITIPSNTNSYTITLKVPVTIIAISCSSALAFNITYISNQIPQYIYGANGVLTDRKQTFVCSFTSEPRIVSIRQLLRKVTSLTLHFLPSEQSSNNNQLIFDAYGCPDNEEIREYEFCGIDDGLLNAGFYDPQTYSYTCNYNYKVCPYNVAQCQIHKGIWNNIGECQNFLMEVVGRSCPLSQFCHNFPCLFGGKCFENANSYRCECTHPFNGTTCSEGDFGVDFYETNHRTTFVRDFVAVFRKVTNKNMFSKFVLTKIGPNEVFSEFDFDSIWTIQQLTDAGVSDPESVEFVCPFTGYFSTFDTVELSVNLKAGPTVSTKYVTFFESYQNDHCDACYPNSSISMTNYLSFSPHVIQPTGVENLIFSVLLDFDSYLTVTSSNWTVYRSTKSRNIFCLVDSDYTEVNTVAYNGNETFTVSTEVIFPHNYRICTAQILDRNGSIENLSLCGYFTIPFPNATALVGYIRSEFSILVSSLFEVVSLDGGGSYDPNTLSNVNISYDWTCQDVTTVKPCSFTLQLYNEDIKIPDLHKAVVNIPVGHMKHNGVYDIHLTVSKDGMESTTKTVTIKPFLPTSNNLYLSIGCSIGCEYFKSDPTKELQLDVSCLTCNSNDNYQYLWTVEEIGSAILNSTYLLSIVTNMNQPSIRFRKNSLTQGKLYYINGTVSNNNGQSSSAGRVIEMNILPSVLCSFTSTTGYEIITEFVLNCNNFTDVDLPLTFHMIVPKTDEFEEERMEIFEGETRDIFLPSGNKTNNYTYNVVIHVSDALGATKIVFLEVQVQSLIDEIGHDDVVEQLLAEVEKLIEEPLLDPYAQLSVKTNIVKTLNKNISTENSTQKLKLREILIDDLEVSTRVTPSNLSQIYLDAEFLALVIDKQDEITVKAEDTARASFQHMSDSFAQLGGDSKNQAKDVAWKLLEGTSKLLEGSIFRGKDYLYALNVTHDHGNNNNNNVTNIHNTTEETSVLKERNNTSEFMKIFDTISDALYDLVEVNQAPLIVETPKVSLIVGRLSSALENFTQSVGSSGAFAFPDLSDSFDSANPKDIPFGFQIGEYKENPYVWSPSSKDIDVPVVSIVLKNINGSDVKLANLTTPLDINVITNKSPSFGNTDYEMKISATCDFYTNEIKSSDSKLFVIPVKPEKTVMVYFKPLDTPLTIQVLPLYEKRNITYQDIINEGYHIPIPDIDLASFNQYKQDPNLLFIRDVPDNERDEFYIGVAVSPGQVVSQDLVDFSGYVNVRVHVEVYFSQCAYWDEDLEEWSQQGCVLTNFSTVDALHCQCNHLTAFSGGMFVSPNILDPLGDAKLFLTFFDNPIVVVTVVIIWVLYIFLLCWARTEDKRDIWKRGVTVLEDDDQEDNYIYLVGVLTGWWRGAGTTADIFIYLRSKRNQSARHALLDSDRQQFTSGSEDWFLLTTPNRLGPIKSVNIWHNNAGNSPSWFLKEVIVKDVQTGESWHCIYNNWLSVDHGPKELRAEIPAVSEDEVRKQSMYQFSLKSSQDFRDSHLWISIFNKPVCSNFSRCQRLTCGLSLLITCMLTNLMFLGVPDTIDPRRQVVSNKIQFDLNAVIIGIESALIMFPINLFIAQSFIRLSPRQNQEVRSKDYYERRHSIKPTIVKKLGFRLPWWFMYISWTIAISSALISSYFVMLYSLKFGYAKSFSWLITFFTSLLQSALITQPCKVLIIAVVVTLVFKRSANYTPSVADEQLADNEEYLHHAIIEKQKIWQESRKQQQHFYIPPMSNNAIKNIQKRVKLEKTMKYAWREIFMYLVFIVIVLLTVHGHRHVDTSYLFGMVNKNMFIDATYSHTIKFNKINTVDHFWNYTQNTLLDNLRQGNTSFTSDNTCLVLGKARLRQLRQHQDKCDMSYYNIDGVSTCSGSYWMTNEDTGNYNKSWTEPLAELCTSNNTEWCYQTSPDLAVPFVGNHGTYPGGGFIVEIPTNTLEAKLLVQGLQISGWVDERTRAIFIEFTLYSPNTNLFSVLALVTEFTNYGGVFPMFQIFTSTLYHYGSDFEMFVAVCECLFIIFILAYTFFEVQKFYKDYKEYFNDVWSFVEVSILLLSYATIGIFTQRIMAVNSVLEVYKASGGERFISFYSAMMWDYTVQYLMACLVTIIVVKVFKLLKFNENMSFLPRTLYAARSLLSGFSVLLLVATVAFVSFGVIVFGSHLEGYSNIIRTILTLLNFLLGVSDYYGLQIVSQTLGPLYFFVYSVFFQYIFITMFLAIIINAFTVVRQEEDSVVKELHMKRYLYSRLRLMVDN